MSSSLDPLPPDVPTVLLQLMVSTPSVEAYLDDLVRVAQGLHPAVAGCGVTLQQGHAALSVATSNALAAAVDEVQYGLGTGPCLEALRTGEVVAVPDMADEERWDGYPEHALAHGVLSSLSVPLLVGGRHIAALNCYGAQPHLATGQLRERVVDFAAQAELALALALRTARQSDVVDQLHTAMQSRSIIDQALGIIMARQRCTADEAFAVLRSASQSRNRKVADIASDIITATSGRPPEAGRFEL